MEPTAATIYECLGELVFGEEDDELQDAVVRLLARRDLTLAVGEWGTVGLLSRWLNDVPDAASYFLGSTIVTSAATARRAIGDESAVTNEDAVWSGTTSAMAQALRGRFHADLGLAVGGASVDSPESNEPPRIALALATRDGVTVKTVPYTGHSAILKPRAAKQALNMLRLELLKESPGR